MKTALVTLGRMPVSLSAARALAQAGLRVIVADPSTWHLARLSRYVAKSARVTAPVANAARYLDEVDRLIDDEDVELVVPSSEESIYSVGLADRLRPHVRLFGMPPDVTRRVHDKGRFVEACLAAGLDAPATAALGSAEGAALAASGDVIVKPLHSCSGIGLSIVRHGEPLPSADPTAPAVVQAFIKGEVYSSFSVAYEGRSLVTLVYRPRVLSGTVAVCFERVDDQPAATAWADRFLAHESWTGFAGFDFIIDADGRPWGIECNPRLTSGVHFLDPSDLGQAILAPEAAHAIRFGRHELMQQFYPCLTETQASIVQPSRFREHLSALMRAKDVTWSLRDPWPFLLMPFAAHPILLRTIFKGESFGAAATHDIAWRGEPLP